MLLFCFLKTISDYTIFSVQIILEFHISESIKDTLLSKLYLILSPGPSQSLFLPQFAADFLASVMPQTLGMILTKGH